MSKENSSREVRYRVFNSLSKQFEEDLNNFYINSNGELCYSKWTLPLNERIQCGKCASHYSYQIFTGLKDINGVELYFDDLVLLQKDIEFADEPYRVIKDDFGIPCFLHRERFGVMTTFETYFMNPSRNRNAFQIIGNIHQP